MVLIQNLWHLISMTKKWEALTFMLRRLTREDTGHFLWEPTHRVGYLPVIWLLCLFVLRLQQLGAFSTGGVFPAADSPHRPLQTHQPPQPLGLGEYTTTPPSQTQTYTEPHTPQTGDTAHIDTKILTLLQDHFLVSSFLYLYCMCWQLCFMSLNCVTFRTVGL